MARTSYKYAYICTQTLKRSERLKNGGRVIGLGMLVKLLVRDNYSGSEKEWEPGRLQRRTWGYSRWERSRHTAKTSYERKQGSADKRQLGSCDNLTGKYKLPLSTTTIADILLAHALTTMIKHLPTLRPSFYTIDIYTQHNLLYYLAN